MINAKHTEELLRCISSRLSGREDCRKLSYIVSIDNKGIWMEPLVEVYPDRYHRKPSDKMSILTYARNQLNEVKLAEFVPGRYEYQLSADGKNRRWRKLN